MRSCQAMFDLLESDVITASNFRTATADRGELGWGGRLGG